MRDSAVVAVLLVTASTLLNAGGQSSPPPHPQAEAQALDLARQAIALRSVRGPGNQTIKVAELFRDALVAGGFATSDITITPVDDTAFMVARWHGSDPSLKPLVISGHLDVVEAKASDWQRDPFTPVVEHGYLYGRGASDMKFDAALATRGHHRAEARRLRSAPGHRHRILGRRGNRHEDLGDDRRAVQQRRSRRQYRRRRRHTRRDDRTGRSISPGRARRRPTPISS